MCTKQAAVNHSRTIATVTSNSTPDLQSVRSARQMGYIYNSAYCGHATESIKRSATERTKGGDMNGFMATDAVYDDSTASSTSSRFERVLLGGI